MGAKPSGHGQSVHGFGEYHVGLDVHPVLWIKELFSPGADWKHLHPRRGWMGWAEQSCFKVLSFVNVQSPWPEETAEPRKGCCCLWGEGNWTQFPPHLFPIDWALPAPRRGPSHCSAPWECAGSSYLLFTAPCSDLVSALSSQLICRQRPRGLWVGATRLLRAPAVVFSPRQWLQ